jgi:hypothetical protein
MLIPLYFIYRHFNRIALAIIFCWFFQHSLMMIKVSGGSKQRTEDKGQTVAVFCHLTSVICYLTEVPANTAADFNLTLRHPLPIMRSLNLTLIDLK